MEVMLFPEFIHLGNFAGSLCGGNAIFGNDAFSFALHISKQENIDGMWTVSQDIVGTSSYDDAWFSVAKRRMTRLCATNKASSYERLLSSGAS